MRKFATTLSASLMSATTALAQTDPNSFAVMQTQAMKGDYQAQRNLAYGYVSWPYKGQNKNPILGCAWYQVILHSGSERLVDCNV